jgi:hypothetical protein
MERPASASRDAGMQIERQDLAVASSRLQDEDVRARAAGLTQLDAVLHQDVAARSAERADVG